MISALGILSFMVRLIDNYWLCGEIQQLVYAITFISDENDIKDKEISTKSQGRFIDSIEHIFNET